MSGVDMPLENVPQELKERKQWILWKMITRAGKDTKVPFQPNGSPAKTDDPSTWSTFEDCINKQSGYSGLGYVFSKEDPYTGIDFDACWNAAEKKISEWAKPWVLKLNSYSEISPSGTGIKVWIKAKFPFGNGKNTKLKDQPQVGGKVPGVEAYDHGRYFCVTGWRLTGIASNPEDRQAVIDELYKKFFTPDQESPAEREKSSRASVLERARRYIDRIPGAISGEAGHNQTWKVACSLIHGFNLGRAESFVLLAEWNSRCLPRWAEKELRHKIESADKAPGGRGYLLKKKESEWDSFPMPEYAEPISLAYENPNPSTEGDSERASIEGERGRPVHSFSVNGDGLYRLQIPEYKAVIEVDRLRREKNELIGELCVKCTLPGIRSFDGTLSIADFNMSSARARTDRARILGTRTNLNGSNGDEIDWIGLIEEFCQRVLMDERKGQSSCDLREIDRSESNDVIRVAGIELPKRHPTILFGDGGAAKSYTALFVAGSMAQNGFKVAMFDWELAGEDHRDRLERLFGVAMPKIVYARCERALVHEVDRLRRIVRDEDVEFAVYDSIAFACDGPPESAEVAGAYFRAVRQIGPGSLHIAHVSKADGADQKPFGCYSSDTEVLTRNGWLRHDQITVNHEVACFDIDKEIIRWLKPLHVHRYKYSGKMIKINGASVNFLVTPNHRMIVKKPMHRKGWPTAWKIIEANKISGTSIKIPGGMPWDNNGSDIFESKSFARFLGWWIAEGSLDGLAPILTQREGELSKKMRQTAEELGYGYNSWVGKSRNRENEQPCMQLRLRRATALGRWLSQNAGTCSHNKKIPRECFEWPIEFRTELFKALIEGDGTWRSSTSGVYSTTSSQLADDVQQLALMNGFTSRVYAHDNEFDVRFGKRKTFEIRSRRHISKVPYNGEVFCLTVPTGAYITRREGNAGISGNSAFWHNGARATWYAKATQDFQTNNILMLGLFNRKSNLSYLQRPVGFRVEFLRDRTFFNFDNVADIPELAEKLTLTQRMKEALKNGSRDLADLADEVGSKPKAINQAVKRNKRVFTVIDGGRIALLQTVY